MKFLNCQAHFTSNPLYIKFSLLVRALKLTTVTTLVTPSVWRLRRGEANLVGVAMVL